MKNILLYALAAIFLSTLVWVGASNLRSTEEQQVSSDEDTGRYEPVQTASGDLSQSGAYETYSPEKIGFADEGNVILFFKAQWCSTCSVLDRHISENMIDIPDNVKILSVDFDTETELKKRYGVTLQHTLVQVNAEGDMIKKWSGGLTLDSVLSEI